MTITTTSPPADDISQPAQPARVPEVEVAAAAVPALGSVQPPMTARARVDAYPVQEKYGLELGSFIIENISVPPEVEQAIDKRSSMAAIGNLNDYVKFKMAEGLGKGGGAAGTAAELDKMIVAEVNKYQALARQFQISFE